MRHFRFSNGRLHAESVPLSVIAERFGTPSFVYSRAAIEQQYHAYSQALAEQPHLICYAVKANSSLAILNILARLGSGFDIVSVGELERVLKAGGDPSSIIFSGVGKRADEMERALEVGIKCFNVESQPELLRLNAAAGEFGLRAPVSLRVNPDVDANTHPYISTGLKENKFGVPWEQAIAVYQQAASLEHIEIVGIDCHIGSQITEIAPFVDAVSKLMDLVDGLKARDIGLQHIDIGGGLGIRYQDETLPSPGELMRSVFQAIGGSDHEILVEPGRSIVGNAGVLLTKVEYLKESADKNFAVVDAGMNDLLRPALYDAWQNILPVIEDAEGTPKLYDIVGPICETGDFIGLDREMCLQPGALLAVFSTGAYGFVMSSNYNTRPRAAEIMVDDQQVYEIRRRETLDELMKGESQLPE